MNSWLPDTELWNQVLIGWITKTILVIQENKKLMRLLPRIYSKETVQFVIRTTLFVCVLIFWECWLINSYLLEIISVARIVSPFLMSQKDEIALTFVIFANKSIIRCTVPNLLPERDETEHWNQALTLFH